MKISFVLPSCNYNIVLSHEELQHLIETGYAGVVRPDRVPSRFRDEQGSAQEEVYHSLDYTSRSGTHSVQFLTIAVEKEALDNGRS